ncbi:MAG: LytTR family DNA-binding domain-containing protein [Muribaculaceae bacterium]|nr:LytTR family DNA-binding domain-containing protein [Muribaculaceae bacterium]
MAALRCLIADDEPLAVKLLESYMSKLDCVASLRCYNSAAQALEAIDAGEVDLAVLDIRMPGLSGLELARAADSRGTAVIFVTAYPDYALEGFRVHAADYLLKPVSFDDFSEAVGRVAARFHSPGSAFITVRSDYRQLRLQLDDILYIEGLKDYVKIFTASRERPVLTLMNLKALENMLPAERFMRTHRSYIVNLDHIRSYDRSAVIVNGISVPVGDTYRSRLIEKL